MRKWMGILAAPLIVGIRAPYVHAQASGAHVDGIIRDGQGLPLPKVKVALTETQTGLARNVDTTNDGAYQFVSLILMRVQVETNNPRPSRETAQALRVCSEPGQSLVQLADDG
ncbi:MAG: carboxypeptidase-like regulatory domain-containing protein, partial [Terriglobia bacterium]